MTPQQSSWARLVWGRTRWKPKCYLPVLGAPVLSHAMTSHCWFLLQTNKQTRKEVEKRVHLPHTTDTFAAASCWAGPAYPPSFLLECCIPTWGWGHICRDATSWQGRAAMWNSTCETGTQVFACFIAWTCVNTATGLRKQEQKGVVYWISGVISRGEKDYWLQVWRDPNGFMYQKRMNFVDPAAASSGQCNF